MNKPVLLHIGYHKTATSWLQKEFFLPVNGFRQVMTQWEVDERIIQPHELVYEPSTLKEFVNSRREQEDSSDIDVISSEMLSGNPFFGGRESCEYAKRLHRAMPDAKILVTIRNQFSILPSVYMQYLQRAGTKRPETFFKDISEPGYFNFSVEHFQYHRLVEFYGRLFSQSNVLVLAQESLSQDPKGFARKICDFCGYSGRNFDNLSSIRRSGVSQPEYMAPLLRKANYFRSGPIGTRAILEIGNSSDFLYRGTGFIGKLPMIRSFLQSRKPVSQYVRLAFKGQFAESNASLQQMTHENLKILGYEL